MKGSNKQSIIISLIDLDNSFVTFSVNVDSMKLSFKWKYSVTNWTENRFILLVKTFKEYCSKDISMIYFLFLGYFTDT